MSKRKDDKELAENELVGWAEQKLGTLKPHASKIALGVCLVFLTFIAITYFIQARNSQYASQWEELNIAITDTNINGNTARLLSVAEQFPDKQAGLWSLQLAGDYDMRTGIRQLGYDREGGLALVTKAKTNLKRVVDAPAALKSADLQQKSLFSLAYACETLGEFDEANKYFAKLVKEAPDSPFAKPAKRGMQRTSDTYYVALYDKFKSFEPEGGDAPGPILPEAPSINIPEIDLDAVEKPAGGGAFGDDGKNADAEKSAADKAVGDELEKPPVQPPANETDKSGDAAGDKSGDETADKKDDGTGGDN